MRGFAHARASVGKQSALNRRGEILVERADRPTAAANARRVEAQYVEWSTHWKRGNRNRARQGFEINEAERIGSAREDEYIRGGIGSGEF